MKDLAISELIIGREVVVDVDETEADARFKQVIANVQREDVNHFDLGNAFVTLKEKYGYQYKEIAEIIGKTPHYVTSKVGLVKRLIPEVQEMAADDMEAANCILDTFSDEENVPSGYDMNIKILEDIARLPGEFQKIAYISIRSKAMDMNEALRYIRSIKKHGLEAPLPERTHNDIFKYLSRIDRDIETLAGRLNVADPMSRQEMLDKLEASLDKLNMLYSRLKSVTPSTQETVRSKALV